LVKLLYKGQIKIGVVEEGRAKGRAPVSSGPGDLLRWEVDRVHFGKNGPMGL
jgi:hypothetical protein